MDSNGELEYKKLKYQLRNLIEPKWALHELNDIQRICFFEAQEYSVIDNAIVEPCNPQAYYFEVCFYRELANLCPRRSQLHTRECERRNNFINSLDNLSSDNDDFYREKDSRRSQSVDSSSDEGFF